jgi:hypothetical protein
MRCSSASFTAMTDPLKVPEAAVAAAARELYTSFDVAQRLLAAALPVLVAEGWVAPEQLETVTCPACHARSGVADYCLYCGGSGAIRFIRGVSIFPEGLDALTPEDRKAALRKIRRVLPTTETEK